MGIKVDISELEKFRDNIAILSLEFNDFLRKFLLDTVLRIIALTKKKQAGKVDPKYKAFDTGYMTSAWDVGEISGAGRDVYVEIINDADYATEIEYGHRIVMGGFEIGYYQGRFMLKTSIDELYAKMPARFEKEFISFFRERGVDVD